MTKPVTPPWTDDETALLKRLLRDKASRKEIALEIGLMADATGRSRNAVCGKIHRLGLSTPFVPKASKPVPIAPKAVRPKLSKPVKIKSAKPMGEIMLQASPEPAKPLNMTFMDIGYGDCRWIIGYPAGLDTLYCGTKTRDGKPYCAYHHTLCYTPVPRRVDIRPCGGLSNNSRIL